MTARLSSAVMVLAFASAACSSAKQDAAADSSAAPAAGAPTAAMGTPAACWLSEGTATDAAARPSPLGEVRFTLGGDEALLCYGRPSAKGRTVMGELVPYGQPWRLGANEATTLHLPFNATVGGVDVDAGTYSLYATPGASEWEFAINRNAQRWGIPIDAGVTSGNVGTFKRPVASAANPVEQLTFRWNGTSETAGELVMEWERAQVAIPVARR